MPAPNAFQAPKGLRDLYPLDAAKRRFITEAWRSTSLRHGFEEVDGPTFEQIELYTVKSGEGIVSEIFGVFSGKDEEELTRLTQTRQAPYALRPEFTPTLARLFAARAGSLPRPTKWFMSGPFFRAERPQRGRLREFLQWNVDMLGDPSPAADAEVIACCVSLLRSLGFTPQDLRVKINHRSALQEWLKSIGIAEERHAALFKLLDQRGKMPPAAFATELAGFGFSPAQADVFQKGIVRVTVDDPAAPPAPPGELSETVVDLTYFSHAVLPLSQQLVQAGVIDWVDFDLSIVRGLAYYTGMVFEVHEAGGNERAVAGGGRYDNLVEVFGGPPTPAVGFGMGDVVISLVMQDKGLWPDDAGVLEATGLRPDVYVLSNGTPEAEVLVRPLVATLRARGLHARHTYKTTRNVGKLLQEASQLRARCAIIVESGTMASVKDLGGGGQLGPMPLEEAATAAMNLARSAASPGAAAGPAQEPKPPQK
jgi:histidyl-tRNA synthetase